MWLQLPLVRPACLGGDRHLQHILMGISHRIEQTVQSIHQCLKQVKVKTHDLVMMSTYTLALQIRSKISLIAGRCMRKSREKGLHLLGCPCYLLCSPQVVWLPHMGCHGSV